MLAYQSNFHPAQRTRNHRFVGMKDEYFFPSPTTPTYPLSIELLTENTRHSENEEWYIHVICFLIFQIYTHNTNTPRAGTPASHVYKSSASTENEDKQRQQIDAHPNPIPTNTVHKIKHRRKQSERKMKGSLTQLWWWNKNKMKLFFFAYATVES